MPIRAARLDAQKVFMQMEELASEAALTADHLPQISECDLPPGRYRWDGAKFIPLPVEVSRPRDDVPSLEEVMRALLRDLKQSGHTLPERCEKWMDWYRSTVDRT